MPADVREQIRQLAGAFDALVDAVTIDEIIGHIEDRPVTDEFALLRSEPSQLASQATWPRLGVAAAAVALIVSLLAALVFIDRGGSDPVSAPSIPSATVTPDPTVPPGQFVWPAPPRGYATLHELIGAFTTEVLDWTAFDVDGDVSNEGSQPHSFNLINTTFDANVAAIAVPSSDGWGFVQIGAGLNAGITNGHVIVEFPRPTSVSSSSVTVRLSDGTTIDTTATSDSVEIPEITLEQLATVLVVGHDVDGKAVSVTGGQFSTDTETVPSTPAENDTLPITTTFVTQAPTDTLGPLEYSGTGRSLPLWPSVTASDPPATTTGYGMRQCDSGYGTKILRLDSPTAASHAYSGTLCVFIELADPRPAAITTCATSAELNHYARCARRTDQTDTAGPGTAQSTVASDDQQAAMTAFPTATRWDQPEVVVAEVSAAAEPGHSVAYQDDTVTVTLRQPHATDEVDVPGVCFVINVPGATADGCVGRSLLATGLAYGAFQDGDGPIELVGIVPDDIASIEIDGTVLTPTNNIWHHTITDTTTPPRITARSMDGHVATTT
jgi:hypothetical protein